MPTDSQLAITIEIDRTEQCIIINDNAGGINKDDMQRAFRPAQPPSDASGLSEFGMGMKSASIWFAPRWEVYTSAIGEPTRKRVCFDLDHVKENRLEELDVTIEPADPLEHFTKVTLRDVYAMPQGRTLGKIREHLKDIYRCFLREDKLKLYVPSSSSENSSESLSFNELENLVAPEFNTEKKPIAGENPKEWHKPIQFELEDGRVVVGQAGLLGRSGLGSNESGLTLFRRNRAIVGTGDNKYRPTEIFGTGNSFANQRLWGELHMDDFEVSHTKDGFNWGNSETEFLEKLKQALDEPALSLRKQAQYFRAKVDFSSETRGTVINVADDLTSVIKENGPEDFTRLINSTNAVLPLPRQLSSNADAPLVEENFTVSFGGEQWQVQIEFVQNSNGRWIELASDTSEGVRTKKVGIRVNLQHAFMQKIVRIDERNSLEPVIRLAAAYGFAEFITRMSDSGLTVLRDHLNDLLSNSLSQTGNGA